MNKRKLLKAFEYNEKKVTAGIKKGLKSLHKGYERWPEKIYKIKTPSLKVAHIPEKPAIKIGIIKAFEKRFGKDKGVFDKSYRIWYVATIDFLIKQEAHIEKNYIHKDVVERDYIKKPTYREVYKEAVKILIENGETKIAAESNACIALESLASFGIKPTECKPEDYKLEPCPHCHCMTKTIKGKCGKCKHRKEKG